MRIIKDITTDKQLLLKIQFDRENPSSDSVTIEAVYMVIYSDAVSLMDTSKILVHRSTTRIDTREAVHLTDDEHRMVINEAAEYIMEL